MARIRSIKPELLEDEKVARLSHLEWRLFVSCLLLADDYGNLRAAVERVRGAALWAYPKDDVAKALDKLGSVGLMSFYVVDDQRYAHVIGWEKHQKVDHPGKPLCPQWVAELAKPSREPRETLAPDLDQDQDQDLGPGGAEPEKTRASAQPPVYVFPVVGPGAKTWDVTVPQFDEWRALFPGIQVMRELGAALAWSHANPTKRKTARGMSAFLVRWLTKAQDRGGSPAVLAPVRQAPESFAARDEREKRERLERDRRASERSVRVTDELLAKRRKDEERIAAEPVPLAALVALRTGEAT